MRFSFTAEQVAFRDAVRDLLEKECSPTAVRVAWTNDSGRVDGLWVKLGEIGLFDETVRPTDIVLVLEETGRACVPEPVVEAFATGGSDATLALAHTPYALYADQVAAIVVEDEGRLVVGTVGERRPSVDESRRLFSVTPGPDPCDLDLDSVRDRAALAAAAQLVGLADAMLELTVPYAAERKQFGVPIGSFQAVKHHLADAALRLEFARPCVYRAAWSMARGEGDMQVPVSVAKAQASEAALLAARQALQVHGAIGYTVEYDLHMWMKRAWALAAAWGDAPWHGRRVKHAILEGNERSL
jgi:alkylation response protein AidB-like acyl-CoA dehydrogenase